jgi:hypothetical protein
MGREVLGSSMRVCVRLHGGFKALGLGKTSWYLMRGGSKVLGVGEGS